MHWLLLAGDCAMKEHPIAHEHAIECSQNRGTIRVSGGEVEHFCPGEQLAPQLLARLSSSLSHARRMNPPVVYRKVQFDNFG